MWRRLLLVLALLAAMPASVSAQAGRPLYYPRELTAADLDGRTLRELVLMRNTIYARAGHPFRKAWLRAYFMAQPWYKPLAKDDGSKITAVDRANAKRISAAEQGVGRAELERRREQILGRLRAGKQTAEDTIELTLLNTRLGDWVSAKPEAEPPPDISPLEDPEQLDRVLKLSQLSDLSRRDLRILRNTIYARHGRPFRSEMLQEYFGAMSWYQPDPTFTEKRMTKVDRTNVRLIKSVEDSLGGAYSDADEKAAAGDMAEA